MPARRFCTSLCVAALVLFCPGCADLGPDRWTVTAKRVRDPRTGQWVGNEVDASLSGPIPTLFKDEGR